MKKLFYSLSFIFLFVITILFTSCGPKRCEVKFHVDEDVYIKTVIIGKTTSAIFVDVFDEYKDLNLKKGDIVSYSVPKGYYDFYIYVDRKSTEANGSTYKWPSNYDYLRPYFRLSCVTSDKDELDIYFSDVYYGNGYSLK